MRTDPRPSPLKWAAAAAFLALWLGLLLPSLERSRLQDVDELWHACTAQNAVLGGHWWPLMLDGRPFFEKPPLVPWLAAVTATVAEAPRAAWPYRVWNVVGGALLLGSILGLGILGGSFWGGLFAAALMGLQGDLIFHCRFFTMDTPFLGLSFSAVLAMAWALSPRGRPWGWNLAGLAFGLAFWSKSWFVLALVPGLGAALWVAVPVAQRRDAAWRVAWPVLTAILLWLALYTSWSGLGFLGQELHGNVLGRLGRGDVSRWEHGRLYLNWAQKAVPAILVLALGLGLGLWPRRSDLEKGSAVARFVRLFGWALSVSWLVGLMLVKDEVINYLLPLEAGLALCLGMALADAGQGWEQGCLASLLLAGSLAMGRLGPAWAYFAVGGALGLALHVARRREASRPLAWAVPLSAALLLVMQAPDAYGLCTRPLDSHRHLAAVLGARPAQHEGEILWAVGLPTRAVDFYSNYQVEHVMTFAEAKRNEAMIYQSVDGTVHFHPAKNDPRPAIKAP